MGEWLTYVAYRVGAGLLGLLPEWMARRLGAGVGWISWSWAKDRKTMSIRHMRRVLGPEADHEKAARAMFGAYGRYWAETLWFRPRRFPKVRRHVSFEGKEHFDAANAVGQRIVAALPHLGNWEMAAAASEDLGIRVTAVAEALTNRRVVDWFSSLRAALTIDVVVAEKGSGTTKKLLTELREGQLVALVADRDIAGTGVEVEFFGERTTLPAGPAALALRTGAALIPVASYFKAGRGHHVVIEPPLVVSEQATRDENIELLTQQLAHAFERQIRRAPTQWHLVQPNWPSDREALGGGAG